MAVVVLHYLWLARSRLLRGLSGSSSIGGFSDVVDRDGGRRVHMNHNICSGNTGGFVNKLLSIKVEFSLFSSLPTLKGVSPLENHHLKNKQT